MYICVFAVTSLVSVSFFTDVLFHRVVVVHSVVDMLREHTARHFPPSSLSSSSPTPRRGHSVCRQALDGFFFFFLLWAEVFCDVWFGFQQLQTNKPPLSLKPDSHVRIWWEPQNAEMDPFFSLSETAKKIHPQQPYFSPFFCLILSFFSLSPTPSAYFQ